MCGADSAPRDLSQEHIKQLEGSQQALQSHISQLEQEWKECSSALQAESQARLQAQNKADKLATAQKQVQAGSEDLQMQIASLEVSI